MADETTPPSLGLTLQLPQSPPPLSRPMTPRSPVAKSGIGWRPVEPGYTAPVVISRTVQVETLQEGGVLRDAIPAMPRSFAIVCLICNIASPGLGTFLSGLSVLCCGLVRPSGGDILNVIWVNSWVALLQFFTTVIFLFGWVWSIVWAFAFLDLSKEYEGLLAERAKERRDEAAHVSTVSHRIHPRRASSTTRTTTTTTTVSMPLGPPATDVPMGRSPHDQPIIVLQEAPVVIQPPAPATEQRPQRTLNPYNPRHQRILRRQNTRDLQESSIFLTAHILNTLVVQGGDGASEASATAPPVK
ncbi:hypothetical protein NP493_801g00006 [Ridgeia piscesae]|uniref:Protein SPEC3 n=1 Tax=Ridgeia piscesae TaxID=27915 RepID=A0AAD9KNE5_RIDPI|nr:hypothetical protein NP493_801g00006 [Ridgeia piscesae]